MSDHNYICIIKFFAWPNGQNWVTWFYVTLELPRGNIGSFFEYFEIPRAISSISARIMI